MPKPLLFDLFGLAASAIVALGVLSYKNSDRPTRNNQTHLEPSCVI